MPDDRPEPEDYKGVEAYPGFLFTFAPGNVYMRVGTWMVVARVLDTATGRWQVCLVGEGPRVVTLDGGLGKVYPIVDPERELNLEMRRPREFP